MISRNRRSLALAGVPSRAAFCSFLSPPDGGSSVWWAGRPAGAPPDRKRPPPGSRLTRPPCRAGPRARRVVRSTPGRAPLRPPLCSRPLSELSVGFAWPPGHGATRLSAEQTSAEGSTSPPREGRRHGQAASFRRYQGGCSSVTEIAAINMHACFRSL